MNFFTIKTFDNFVDAHLLKAKLESEGITCFLFDENMVSLNPLYNVTIGGIKLNVQESDSKQALEILSEIENTLIVDDNNEVLKCPKCNSGNIYSNFKSMKDFKGVVAAIISLVFVIFPIYYKSVHKCKNCGEEF